MKMKKLLAGLLSAAMVVTSVSFGGFGVNEVEAAVETTETVEQLGTVYEGTELVTNATSNSFHTDSNASCKDGAAGWAFDDADHWWHSEWEGSSVINLPNYNRDNNTASGTQHANNRIWIQTGFSTPQNLTGLEYTSRRGTTNNQIREYEVWVKSTEAQPATTEVASAETGWTKVADDCFYPTAEATGQNAKFDAVATNVKWVRLVAKNVYGVNAYAAAKKIRFYTTTTPTQVNLNNYKAFWESEYANGTLAKQTENDRWRFEFKDANGWKQYGGVRCGRNDGQFFEGSWRLREDGGLIPLISNDGFRQWLHSTYQANALTWVAPKAGYYKFEQLNTASTRNVAGELKVYLVKNNQTTEDGTLLDSGVNKNTGVPFQTKIQKMEAGDRFRFASIRGNNVNNYCDGNPTVTWQATPCTAREYATQYMAEVTLNAEKPKALQDDVTEVKGALKALVDNTETTDAAIEQEIKDLEAAVARMNNYKGMTSVVFDKTTTQTLNINDLLTLNVSTNPAEYSEVEWTVTPVTGTNVVEQGLTDKNQFTAKAPGKVTIKATSVYDNAKSAEVTVIVKADTKELEAKIKEAEGYVNGSYTQESLEFLNTILGEARDVRDSAESTETQINDAIKALNDAIKALDVLYRVNVTGGKLADDTTTAAVIEGTELTVTAEAAQPGQKFSHWELSGKPVCYASTYTFTVYNDITLTAKYVQDTTQIEKKASMFCTATFDPATSVIKFTAKRSVPAGATIVRHGMILTNQVTWEKNFVNTPQNFILGNRGMITKTGTTKGLLGNYSAGVRCTKPNTWYAKGYVEYTLNGKTETVYSDVVSYTVK